MEVVLKEDVEKLGEAGAKVKVAGGYARNYLIPQGLAIAATSAAAKVIEQHMKVRAKRLAALKAEAEAYAAKLSTVRLSFTRRAGEEGKLFGSVTGAEVWHGVTDKGFDVDKRKILLDMPIKQLGEQKIGIKLHPEVTAEITVEVVAEEEAPSTDAPAAAEENAPEAPEAE